MNTLKVGVLLVALTGLFVFLGNLIGGATGAAIAFVLAFVMNVGSFWFSDKLVLRMTRARPVSPAEAPDLHRMVERLAERAKLPKPAVYVVDDPSPNAFATGRSPKHAAVAVNTGLLNLLSRDEVEGVIAHELAHIRSRDTLTMTVVATIAGAIMMLANFAQFAAFFGGSDEDGPNPLALLLMAVIAPFAAMMVQMGISRAREFEADRIGAEIAGSPLGLANALRKLEKGTEHVRPRTAQPQTAPLYIVNPFAGAGGIARLFMTHPPVEQRVKKLLERQRLVA